METVKPACSLPRTPNIISPNIPIRKLICIYYWIHFLHFWNEYYLIPLTPFWVKKIMQLASSSCVIVTFHAYTLKTRIFPGFLKFNNNEHNLLLEWVTTWKSTVCCCFGLLFIIVNYEILITYRFYKSSESRKSQ